MIPAETIREMLKSATPGKWKHTNTGTIHAPDGLVCEASVIDEVVDEEQVNNNFTLIASAPELAQKCLELYARVQLLEKNLNKGACNCYARNYQHEEGCSSILL